MSSWRDSLVCLLFHKSLPYCTVNRPAQRLRKLSAVPILEEAQIPCHDREESWSTRTCDKDNERNMHHIGEMNKLPPHQPIFIVHNACAHGCACQPSLMQKTCKRILSQWTRLTITNAANQFSYLRYVAKDWSHHQTCDRAHRTYTEIPERTSCSLVYSAVTDHLPKTCKQT